MRKGSVGEYHWEKINGRWQFIDGRWYYLNPVSDGTRGIMCVMKRIPAGWLVKKTAAGMKKQKDSVIENNIEKAGLAKLSPAFHCHGSGRNC